MKLALFAMVAPACIGLSLLFVAFIENATDATETAIHGAFSTNLLGSKYQMYAETYRGRERLGGTVRLTQFCRHQQTLSRFK